MVNSAHRLISTVSVVCAMGAAGLLAPSISDATAGSPAASVGLNRCTPSPLSRPFARWLDFAQYELVPGGDFESPTWTLTGGADRVPGSEPYAVSGRLGTYSLSMPAGSSAHSPRACVGARHPSMRFFISGQGSVRVAVVDGSTVIPAGVVVASGGWAPTPVVLTSLPVMGAGGTAQVSVTVTGLLGSPRIDDVFIDPWSRG